MPPRKKKPRICAHCGKTITRVIKRVEKDTLLFCTPDEAIAYHSVENQVKSEPEREQKQQRTRLMAVKDIKRINPNWINDPLYVYIGRKVQFHPMSQSLFHNPYRVQKLDRRKSINAFERYFYQRVQKDSAFKKAVEGLRGKILVCWCSPPATSCHGDVLLRYLHQPKTLEDYQKKIEEVPQVDPKNVDLIYNLIRLHEIEQDTLNQQFTFEDRRDGVEGAVVGWELSPRGLSKKVNQSLELVVKCLLVLNHHEHKVWWRNERQCTDYIESKDHYVQRNYTDYKKRVKIGRRNQIMMYRLFGGRPQEVSDSDREIIKSR